MRIYFESDLAWARLVTFGQVYTLRREDSKPGERFSVYRRGSPTGIYVRKDEVALVDITNRDSLEALDVYVNESGFSTVANWVRVGSRQGYLLKLFRVTILEGDG